MHNNEPEQPVASEKRGLEKRGLEKRGLEKRGLEKRGLEKRGLERSLASQRAGLTLEFKPHMRINTVQH